MEDAATPYVKEDGEKPLDPEEEERKAAMTENAIG